LTNLALVFVIFVVFWFFEWLNLGKGRELVPYVNVSAFPATFDLLIDLNQGCRVGRSACDLYGAIWDIDTPIFDNLFDTTASSAARGVPRNKVIYTQATGSCPDFLFANFAIAVTVLTQGALSTGFDVFCKA
jgi:hypothetical protein